MDEQPIALFEQLCSQLFLLLSPSPFPSPRPRTRFPISPSRADFFEGKHAGRKQIKRLSNADRAIIESLEPWRGGDNPLLIALHDIDIARKHRRLIGVSATPQWMTVIPSAIETGLELVRGWPGFKNDTIIATANINAPNSEFHFSLQATLDEAGPKG
jgi:hypothetical protein